MKKVARYLVVAVISTLLACQTVSAVDENLSGAGTGQPINEVQSGQGYYPAGNAPADFTGQAVAPYGQVQGQSPFGKTQAPSGSLDLQQLLGRTNADQQQKEMEGETEPTRKTKLAVKVAPGDSIIDLSWKLLDLKSTVDPATIKYSVVYGTESGQYTKRADVGPLTSYRLRELKNNNTYFLRVLATDKKNVQLAVSDEIHASPVPEEDLGSPLEQAFARKTPTLQDKVEVRPLNRELKQFGYDFFKNTLLVGTTPDNMPVGSDYVVGPGDSLRIDIWGAVQARFDLTVDRNGEIAIPKVGVVKVWGLSYRQAKEVINTAIGRIYKGYELNVTLGKLRSIQVFVVGEVESPGVYSISSLGTVINALAAAGGPSRNGSLRTIKILRNGKAVQDVDLYDMFLSGDRSKDIRLESGDTVFVPVIGPVVGITGEVKRPAIFELKGKTTLGEVLAMAGGVTAAGDTERIQVERIEGNHSRVVVDFEPKKGESLSQELAQSEMTDRDMVKVFPVLDAVRQVVTLTGNVVRPGEYQFRKGMRVTDVLPDYAALLPDSYMEAAEIIRLVPPDLHKSMLSFNLKKALAGDKTEDVPLHEQDTVKVFSRWDLQEKPMVSVNGQVQKPGSYEYYPNMTVRDLIDAAGSIKRNAYLDNAELTRVVVDHGQAKSVRIDLDLGKALAGDSTNNLVLKPDDVLIVRGIVDWLETADRFVTLKGEVRFPGIYSITKGERLSSAIARAGGYTDKAYLRGAKFTRKSVRLSQQMRMDEVIARTEKDIMQKQAELASVAASKEELDATRAALEGLMKNLDRLKTKKAEGRVVIHLASLDRLRKSDYDLLLEGGDELTIPQTPSVVNVMGEVYNPTTFVYMPDTSVSYYLSKAGGPDRNAEEDDMYVIQADGSVKSRQQSTFGIRWDEDSRSWTFGSFMSSRMEPGDTLVVPQKLERTAWLRDIKDLTTIVSQVALTAGTILLGLK